MDPTKARPSRLGGRDRPNNTLDNIQGERDDRVFLETRILAAIIVPFLLVAFVILYLFPDRTKDLFAWGIAPPMTAMMLASAYIGGAYFFIRVIAVDRWHRAALGFPAVATFASLMGIATALHWDRFTQGHVAFYAWATLYAVTPFLVVAVWLRNRRADPGIPEQEDALFAPSLRAAFGAVGLMTLLVSLLLFLRPAVMIGVWPWPLTPLTARVLGGLFSLPGVVGLGLALDPRWSAARITLESQILALTFMIVAIIRAWPSFNESNPLTWVFALGLSGLVLALAFLHFQFDRRLTNAEVLPHG